MVLRRALAALSVIALVSVPATARAAEDNVRPMAPKSGATNVGAAHREGNHVSIPVQVSALVASTSAQSASETVGEGAIAVPRSLRNPTITLDSVVGYDKNGTPHKTDLNRQMKITDDDSHDDKDGIGTSVVKMKAEFAGFGSSARKDSSDTQEGSAPIHATYDTSDGTLNTDSLYDVYEVDALGRDVSRATMFNYRIEGEMDNGAVAPVVARSGLWRCFGNGEYGTGSLEKGCHPLADYEWMPVAELPDYTDPDVISEMNRREVKGAGVDWDHIRATKDGDDTRVGDDVNPGFADRRAPISYVTSFSLRANTSTHFAVSGLDSHEDALDMALIH
ncbi:hypothetical protein [Cutibacterium granulosum]|jgi:hypothetical protein|uniref:hypothetical protein n=1 Tax=Cutibacterium granulosum TaxID=33011 RepID=UPI002573CFDE|nr:hypothetical protein [Cutibacterium granulosum]MDU1523136.1 hypothetical protein [Cutibacterium granulosum]MDU7728059.1 hypothetical protein [Cutibacterium granulosum]